MALLIRMTETEELKALPVLLRHSRGVGLRNRVYVVDEGVAEALRAAGVRFAELSSGTITP